MAITPKEQEKFRQALTDLDKATDVTNHMIAALNDRLQIIAGLRSVVEAKLREGLVQ